MISAQKLLQRLSKLSKKNGWQLTAEQGKGSHKKIRLNDKMTVIPWHSRDLPKGTLIKILKDLGLTLKEIE